MVPLPLAAAAPAMPRRGYDILAVGILFDFQRLGCATDPNRLRVRCAPRSSNRDVFGSVRRFLRADKFRDSHPVRFKPSRGTFPSEERTLPPPA